MYNSMAFSILQSCATNHDHLIPEHFHHPKKKHTPISGHFPVPSSPSAW